MPKPRLKNSKPENWPRKCRMDMSLFYQIIDVFELCCVHTYITVMKNLLSFRSGRGSVYFSLEVKPHIVSIPHTAHNKSTLCIIYSHTHYINLTSSYKVSSLVNFTWTAFSQVDQWAEGIRRCGCSLPRWCWGFAGNATGGQLATHRLHQLPHGVS